MSDIRFIAWAGYQFDYSTADILNITLASVCPPEFDTEDIGELQITGTNLTNRAKVTGKDLKPKMVAFPPPTV